MRLRRCEGGPCACTHVHSHSGAGQLASATERAPDRSKRFRGGDLGQDAPALGLSFPRFNERIVERISKNSCSFLRYTSGP